MKTSTEPVRLELASVDSTNQYVKEQILAKKWSRAALWARKQTAGRGRLGRRWLSPEGGFYLSLGWPAADVLPVLYGVATGVTTAEYLEERYGLAVRLKWPNDLVVGERKLAGILAEYVVVRDLAPHVVVGMGLNLNQPITLPQGSEGLSPTSLLEETGKSVSLSSLAEELVSRLFEELGRLERGERSQQGSRTLLDRWRSLSATLGRHVLITLPDGNSARGQATGIDEHFSLILQTDNAEKIKIHAGDCYHLRPE